MTSAYKASAAIRRARIPAVEAPIRTLVAALPVDEAEAAEADDEEVGLPEAPAELVEPEVIINLRKLIGSRWTRSGLTSVASCCRGRIASSAATGSGCGDCSCRGQKVRADA